MMNSNPKRIVMGILAVGGLLCVYLFQRDIQDFLMNFGYNRFSGFVYGRMARFLLNDFLTILLIAALFPQRKYILFALIVQLAGFVVILLPYLMLKYFYPDYNGPLISFLHRLVMNPILLMLLIPAFILQRQKHNE